MALNEDRLTAYFLPDLVDDFLHAHSRFLEASNAVLTRRFGANPMVLVDPRAMHEAFGLIIEACRPVMPPTGGAVSITIGVKSNAATVGFMFTAAEGAAVTVPEKSRRIIADHHGSIALHSSGGCVEMVVSIPRHVPSAAFVMNEPQAQKAPPHGENNLVVLIADDESSIRELLRMILNSIGITSVSEADNGEDARSMVVSGSFDAVFMDVSMPVLSGIEAFRMIKKEKPGARIIFITGIYQDDEIKEIVEKEGAYGYIRKPFNIMEVRQVVAGIVRDMRRDERRDT